MSYLDLPRLYFSGRFFANPSTINNKLANYSPDVRLLPHSPSRQPLSVLEEYAGFQYLNPSGLHNFFFADTVVTGFHGQDARCWGGDAPLGTVASGAPYAKMVDLDPDQQSISQIFGLSLQIQLVDGSGFQGTMEATSLHDLWYGRVPSETGDQMAAGCFQSLLPLESITWRGEQGSMINALRERCVTGISIKFVLDAYQGNHQSPDFNYGRVVGALGPGLPDEPIRFPGERRLNPRGAPFGPGYWKLHLQRKQITLDLSNSAPLREPAGESLDVGAVHAVILRDSTLERLHHEPLDYGRRALTLKGGLIDLPITDEQCSLLERYPLGLLAEPSAGPPSLLLQEDPSLKWINCEPAWLRLAPGERGAVTFHARRAGQPLRGEEIDLQITRHHINNRPRSGIQFPARARTDERGQAQVEIRAGNPQPLPPRRAVIDSQVYYIGGSWQAAGELTRQSGGGALSVLVFNETVRVDAPTWNDHVGPILLGYARLYPGVVEILGIRDYEGVRARASVLRRWLTAPHDDPMHFPPSRDLAPEKARMICRWIDQGMPFE